MTNENQVFCKQCRRRYIRLCQQDSCGCTCSDPEPSADVSKMQHIGGIMRNTGLLACTVLLTASLQLHMPVRAQDFSNGEALLRGWEWWKGLSELAREQAAPKLIDLVGKSGQGVTLAATSIDNLTRYRALCGRKAGTFRESQLCKGLQFRFGERSNWSTVTLALWRRAGTDTAPAREAAAILAGLRAALELDRQKLPAQPQHVIGGLYAEFGRCAPPACTPGLQDGSALRSWLSAAAGYAARNGADGEARAGRDLQKLGWRE